MTMYGKEQSLRLGDAAELKFSEKQGGIGSVSRPLLEVRNSPRDAGVEPRRLFSVFFRSILIFG